MVVTGAFGGLVSIFIGDERDGYLLAVGGDVFVAALHGQSLLVSVVLVFALLLSGGSITGLEPGDLFRTLMTKTLHEHGFTLKSYIVYEFGQD